MAETAGDKHPVDALAMFALYHVIGGACGLIASGILILAAIAHVQIIDFLDIPRGEQSSEIPMWLIAGSAGAPFVGFFAAGPMWGLGFSWSRVRPPLGAAVFCAALAGSLALIITAIECKNMRTDEAIAALVIVTAFLLAGALYGFLLIVAARRLEHWWLFGHLQPPD
jgi:hypothetical protein